MGGLDLGDAGGNVSSDDDGTEMVKSSGEEARILFGSGVATGVARCDETDTSLEVVASFWGVVHVDREGEWERLGLPGER